jgi:hypothetical protein
MIDKLIDWSTRMMVPVNDAILKIDQLIDILTPLFKIGFLLFLIVVFVFFVCVFMRMLFIGEEPVAVEVWDEKEKRYKIRYIHPD